MVRDLFCSVIGHVTDGDASFCQRYAIELVVAYAHSYYAAAEAAVLASIRTHTIGMPTCNHLHLEFRKKFYVRRC